MTTNLNTNTVQTEVKKRTRRPAVERLATLSTKVNRSFEIYNKHLQSFEKAAKSVYGNEVNAQELLKEFNG